MPLTASTILKEFDSTVVGLEHVQCSFCKQWGHSFTHCMKAFMHNRSKAETCCSNGVHMPWLHDHQEFRCRWCAKHMDKKQVYYGYPEIYDKEMDKVSSKVRSQMVILPRPAK